MTLPGCESAPEALLAQLRAHSVAPWWQAHETKPLALAYMLLLASATAEISTPAIPTLQTGFSETLPLISIASGACYTLSSRKKAEERRRCTLCFVGSQLHANQRPNSKTLDDRAKRDLATPVRRHASPGEPMFHHSEAPRNCAGGRSRTSTCH